MRRLFIGIPVLVAAALLLAWAVAHRGAVPRATEAAPPSAATLPDAPDGLPPRAATSARRTVRVQVLDSTNRRPIVGAVLDGGSVPGTTDADGFASLALDLREGVRLLVCARGFVPSRYRLEENDRDPWISLLPGIPVSGRAIHANGEPAARATLEVELSPDLHFPVPLDPMGRFEIPGLPEGAEVKVHAREEGYWPVDVSFTATPGKTPMEIMLGQGGACAGVVLDEEGHPVAGARVTVKQQQPWFSRPSLFMVETESDAEGHFSAAGLPPDEYSASVVTTDYRAGESEPFAADTDAPPHRVAIVVHAASYVALTIRDPNGALVTDATVSFGRGSSVRSSPSGEYLSLVGAGRLSLEVDGWGHPPEIDVDVKPGVRNDVTFQLEERMCLAGTVVDGRGTPIEGCYLHYLAWDEGSLCSAWTHTGADGSFRLRGLDGRPGKLDIEAHGLVEKRLDGRPGQPPVRIVLDQRAPRVVGRIDPPPEFRALTADFGSDTPSCVVVHRNADTLVDREGRFELDAPAGKHWLRIQTRGSLPWIYDRLELLPDATLDLGVLTVGEGTTVTGVVVDRSGAPVADAKIGVLTAARGFESYDARADGEGRFSIASLPLTTLTIHARHDGYITGWLTLDPARNTDPLRIVLDPGGVLVVRMTAWETVKIEPVGGGECITLNPLFAMDRELPPGLYRVEGRVVEVRAGETTVVDLDE